MSLTLDTSPLTNLELDSRSITSFPAMVGPLCSRSDCNDYDGNCRKSFGLQALGETPGWKCRHPLKKTPKNFQIANYLLRLD